MCGAYLLSCLTLCDPVDCSFPGSSGHGILQARILEWVAMPSSRESSHPRGQTHVSCVAGSEPPGIPKNTGLGGPIPSPGDLPNPGIEPGSPAFQADALPSEPPGKPMIYNAILILYNIF